VFYLIGYFILLAGASWALWQSGALEHIPDAWIAIAAAVAVGSAIVLALVSRRPQSNIRS